MDLQEADRPNSSAYLKQLVEYQEELRRQHGPDTKVWSRPRLVDEKAEIDRLAVALEKAETAHYEGRNTYLKLTYILYSKINRMIQRGIGMNATNSWRWQCIMRLERMIGGGWENSS